MRRRPHPTRWALLIYRSSRLSCEAQAAIRSFSSRRSRSIATRRVFAANNCFLIAATCVGERVGASVMLSGYSSHRRQAARSSGAVLALIDRGGDNSHHWAPSVVVGEGALVFVAAHESVS